MPSPAPCCADASVVQGRSDGAERGHTGRLYLTHDGEDVGGEGVNHPPTPRRRPCAHPLKGLRVYLTEGDAPPIEMPPPPSPRNYWTRRGIAECFGCLHASTAMEDSDLLAGRV
jgi:hypothetical protein